MRWTLAAVVMLSCGRLGVSPATDAGAPPDGGGQVDVGWQDAGPGDAGLVWQQVDGGGCPPSPFATAAELASTPRAEPGFEALGIEATGAFICDQGTYLRIIADVARLKDPDSGQAAFGYIPDVHPSSLIFQLDDAGSAAARAGQYREWDCLNFTYRATEVLLWPSVDRGALVFAGAYEMSRLASQYAALPHMVSIELNGYGICAMCGCASDACLEIDGGTFTWLGFRDDSACNRTWTLATSFDDGGLTVDLPDANQARAWRQAHPACARHLWGHSLADGGVR